MQQDGFLAVPVQLQLSHTRKASTLLPLEDDRVWGSLSLLSDPSGSRVEFRFPKLRYTIGRGTGRTANAVDCSFPHVARMSQVHCSFEAIGYGTPHLAIKVADLGSSNGTWINSTNIGHRKSMMINHDGAIVSFSPWGKRPREEDHADDRIELRVHRRQDKPVSDPSLRPVEELYRVGDALGKGGFGEVKKALHLEEGKYYAIKFIPESQASSASRSLDEVARARHLRHLREEIEILKRVQHAHIVQFKEAVRYGVHGLGLVIELMHGGDLEQYLNGHGALSEWNTKYLAHQICSALAYLHQNDIVHRDLKPKNILLSSRQPPVAKLADFGLAKIVDSNALLSRVCGTELFMAPEVQEGKVNQTTYDKVIDSWSLGVTLSLLLWLKFPFKNYKTLELNVSLLQSDTITPACQDVLTRLLKLDPKDRLTPSAALEHAWLSEGVIWVAELESTEDTDSRSLHAATPTTSIPQPAPHSRTNNYEYGPIPLVHIQAPTRTVGYEPPWRGSDFLLAAMLRGTEDSRADHSVDGVSSTSQRPLSATDQPDASHTALFVSLFGHSVARRSFAQQ